MQTSKILPLAVVAALSAGVLADDSTFSFSGFGTLSSVRTNTDQAQFRAGTLQPVGADKTGEYGVDAKLGLQAQAKVTNDFSATVQVLSQRDADDSFWPRVEWAYLKYQVSPQLSVRLGRMGMPIFLISDYRNVGYANPWARPPVDVYGQVAVGIFDGADLIWKQAVGDGTSNVQPFLGTAKSHLPGNFNFKFKQLVGANATYEIGSWLFRAGYVHTKIDGHSPNLDGLVAVMQTVPLPGWSQATSALVIEHKDASFAGLGVTYDDGQWLFQSEYTQRRTDSFVDDTNGWYSTLGYRFGDVMPYVSYGHVDTQVNHVTDGLFAPTPQLAGLKAAVIDTKAGADQHTASIGARWNFHKNVDFKLQYDHVTTETGKDNFFVNAKPSFAGHSVSVITAAFDFVF